MQSIQKPIRIKLSTIQDVKSFVNIMEQFQGNFDLAHGRYLVDAKSVMGIFSMDLSKELELRILETEETEENILKALQPYIVSC